MTMANAIGRGHTWIGGLQYVVELRRTLNRITAKRRKWRRYAALMGDKRSSTTQQRLDGEDLLPPAATRTGVQVRRNATVTCTPHPQGFYVLQHRQICWIVTFVDQQTGKPIGTVAGIAAIRTLKKSQSKEIAKRGGALKTQEDHHALAYSISKCQGNLILELMRE
jgi:hypothetical protein